MLNNIIQSIKYFFKSFSYLKVFNSPFIRPRFQFYFGKIKIGTPIFLPRKWVKCNKKDAIEKWDKLEEKVKESYLLRYGSKENYYNYYIKAFTKPIPIKYFGIHHTSLGWKTKWDEIRHEWNPGLSIVFLNRQLVISLSFRDTMIDMCYWEAWLYYYYETEKNLSKVERLKEVLKLYDCTWEYKGDHVNYYNQILKSKYKYLIRNETNI